MLSWTAVDKVVVPTANEVSVIIAEMEQADPVREELAEDGYVSQCLLLTLSLHPENPSEITRMGRRVLQNASQRELPSHHRFPSS